MNAKKKSGESKTYAVLIYYQVYLNVKLSEFLQKIYEHFMILR